MVKIKNLLSSETSNYCLEQKWWPPGRTSVRVSRGAAVACAGPRALRALRETSPPPLSEHILLSQLTWLPQDSSQIDKAGISTGKDTERAGDRLRGSVTYKWPIWFLKQNVLIPEPVPLHSILMLSLLPPPHPGARQPRKDGFFLTASVCSSVSCVRQCFFSFMLLRTFQKYKNRIGWTGSRRGHPGICPFGKNTVGADTF